MAVCIMLMVGLCVRSENVDVVTDSAMTGGKLIAVEGGLEFAELGLLTEDEKLEVCENYRAAFHARRSLPMRPLRAGVPALAEDYESVGTHVREGRSRLHGSVAGSVSNLRRMAQQDWSTMPGLGSLERGSFG